jgi:dienelactone hydrolase
VFAAQLRRLLGSFTSPQRWSTTCEESLDFDDHRREALLLTAPGCRPLPLYVLTPRGDSTVKRPGIVALHGHGPFGNDPVVGIATTAEHRKSIADANYDYGLQLVRRGYVVAAPCFTPFGRRLGDLSGYEGQDPCAVTFLRMQALGRVLMAENLHDALWSLALLARHERVDPDRLGCVGLSYGGRMTMLAVALVMQERIAAHYSCGAQIIPGLLEYGDVPEIASLIAPRPCLWEVGSRDPLMARAWIEPALQRIRRAYHSLGAAHNLEVDFFDGEHRWNGARAYPFLEGILRP